MRSIGATSSGTRSRAARDAGSRSEIAFALIGSVTLGASGEIGQMNRTARWLIFN
jgi:hypothetical protein